MSKKNINTTFSHYARNREPTIELNKLQIQWRIVCQFLSKRLSLLIDLAFLHILCSCSFARRVCVAMFGSPPSFCCCSSPYVTLSSPQIYAYASLPTPSPLKLLSAITSFPWSLLPVPVPTPSLFRGRKKRGPWERGCFCHSLRLCRLAVTSRQLSSVILQLLFIFLFLLPAASTHCSATFHSFPPSFLFIGTSSQSESWSYHN